MESVRRFFRHLFVPHRGNGHRPHILRSGAVTAILAIVLVVQLAACAEIFLLREGSGALAAVISSVLVDLTNQARASENIAKLSVNPLLKKAAQAKADDMALRGYFAHVSPGGRNPWDWIKSARYSYEYAGENLAVNFTDSSDVVTAWMASPEHRANIEKPNYTEIGIATASGVYQGKSAIFVVQMFGSPAAAARAASAPPAHESAPSVASVSNAAGKVLAAESVKPALPVPAPLPSAPKLVGISPAVPAAKEASPLIRAFVSSPGRISQIALAAALGLFALALFIALLVRRHLVHPETLRNGALALAVVMLAIFLHANIFSSSVMLPSSGLGASASVKAK